MKSKVWNGSCLTDREKRRQIAIETVDGLFGDIESAVKRGAAVFGISEMLTDIIPSFLGLQTTEIKAHDGQVYTGERRNLTTLLECDDWASTFLALADLPKKDDVVRAGDYFRLPIKAEAGKHDSLEFAALDIKETERVVVQTTPDKIILNFEDILFHSAVNEKNTNKGGFHRSALANYLNVHFLLALKPVEKVLARNKDGDKVTLPTLYEVAADDDYGNEVNWEDEQRQLEYFKQIKNRIRTEDNDTRWWWLSNAAHSTYFASVASGGHYQRYGTGTDCRFCGGGIKPSPRWP